MLLSLAMIVKNEAARVGHCLRSVRGLADEVVLVDTGSTDGTPELARQEGARVFHFPWSNDFAAARNESLRHCLGDWVLVLDADEAIDAADHALILATCQAAAFQAYHVTLRNYHTSGSFCVADSLVRKNTSAYREGREYPYFVDTLGLRLCQRTRDLAFTGRIHELLDPYFSARALPVGNLAGAVIHHYGKLDEDRERAKGQAYLQLALQDLKADPVNTQFLYNVVQQGLQARDWPVVLAAAEAYRRLRPEVPSLVLFGAGLALQNLGRPQEALDSFDRLLQGLPGHELALVFRGIGLVSLGREAEAEGSFRKAIQINPGFSHPYACLTDLAFKQGRIDEARAIIQQGLASCPADPLVLKALILLDLRSQDMEQATVDARMALEALPSEGGGLWHRLAALAEQKEGRTLEALALLERGMALFPEKAELRRMHDELAAAAGLPRD